jgi:hypothetical protein
MNRIIQNRTTKKNGKPFTFNKDNKIHTYKNVQPKFGLLGCCPDATVGCNTCLKCMYVIYLSGVDFGDNLPQPNDFVAINPCTNDYQNTPINWEYSAIIADIVATTPNNYTIWINIENNACIEDIKGLFIYKPKYKASDECNNCGNCYSCNEPTPPSNVVYGYYYGYYYLNSVSTLSPYQISVNKININDSTKKKNPFRNPLAGWRKTRDCCDKHRNPNKTIYKDIWAKDGGGCCFDNKSKSGIQGRTKKPLIRSGMQPKKSCFSNKKCTNDYSFSYRQYQHNNRCLSFERSEEHFIPFDKKCKRAGKCIHEFRKGACRGCAGCSTGNNKAKTIYKPNNKKFSKQGAVTSGGRLERLKLNTIRKANACKNNPCKAVASRFTDGGSYKYPKGKYFAGKPRYTNWRINKDKNVNKYNQQPFGIPQLTAHPPGNTCIKKCFPRRLKLSVKGPTAAGNRGRTPGITCC